MKPYHRLHISTGRISANKYLSIHSPQSKKMQHSTHSHLHTVWLVSTIIENTLLIIAYKNIMPPIINHSSSSPPKILIRPKLIIPPLSSFSRLLTSSTLSLFHPFMCLCFSPSIYIKLILFQGFPFTLSNFLIAVDKDWAIYIDVMSLLWYEITSS